MRWNRGIRAGLVGTSAIMVVSAFPGIAFAQQSATGDGTSIAQPATDAETPTGAVVSKDGEPIVVTGSRIKQDPNDSALPLQILTTQTFQRNAITSAEQMLSFLTSNGTGADNLASNSDVTDATRRGNNGASSANLRGQGSGATLILLNGKRVAAHGLTGGAVDVNQIPFAAIERVEVLKDGASAIYGTDAVGGVINFITKKDFTGLDVTGSNNITQYGDAPIYQISATAGYGKLDDQGFNIMGSVSYNYRGALKASQRSFVNTFQHDKGLGVDTRGTPFATIVPLAGTAIASSAATPYVDGTTQLATGGVNILRLPGQAGCDSVALQGDYDTDVWGAPGNGLACTYDTGRSVYLQQQQKTFTYYTKATKRFGDHELSVEFTGSSAKADKRFSQIQVTPNTTTQNYSYKLVPGVNDAKYNEIYDILSNYYASQGQAVPFTYGQGFSYRWRCMECGEREIKTKTTTFRVAADLTGPMFGDWTYDVSGLYTQSKSGSVLGQGYYYTDKLVSALNSGYVDPFLFAGETQSAEGLAALQSASAAGVSLYNGKYSVWNGSASVSGSLFDLPAGTVKAAVGLDWRREGYEFTGDTRVDQDTIYSAPFDNGNALDGVHRTVKAAYAEVLIPIIKGMEVDAAGRIDDYSGFGTTTNPKVSIKYRPWQPIMFRASYSTAFRVPSFNQLFNASYESVYTGADYADPAKCAGGVVNVAAGCPALSSTNGNTFSVKYGGRTDLGPETADEWGAGVVIQPANNISFSADWWLIKRKNTIQTLALQYLFTNYDLFKDQFHYDANGNLTLVDDTYVNTGGTTTQGIDFTFHGAWPIGAHGQVDVGLDGTWLLEKKEKVAAGSASIDELGVYSLADDLGLRWKHNAYVSYSTSDWSVTLTQIFRSGYKNQVLPGVAAGTFDPCCDVTNVKPYILYNLSASYTGIDHLRLTAGITNLFNTDPPFAISYDSNYGSGSDWEPRVADPRGRSFNITASVTL